MRLVDQDRTYPSLSCYKTLAPLSENAQMPLYTEEAPPPQDSMLDHMLTAGNTTRAKGYEGIHICVGYGMV